MLGIDKTTLIHSGVAAEDIRHIYRALYVLTNSFYDMVRKVTERVQKERIEIITRIWSVYQMLLELTHPTQFKLLTSELETQQMLISDNILTE